MTPNAASRSCFAFGFAGKILRRKFGGRELVGLRTPLVVVDAVENSGDRRGAVAQHAFQTESVFGGLNLLTVFPADRGDEVGIGQRAFEKVHLAEEFHLRHGEEIPGQHEQRKSVGREQSLVAHVVDGEDRADVAEGGILGVDGAEQNRNQGRLPVVTMKNVGDAQNFRSLEHGAREQSKALGVVGIVPGRRAVEGVAVEIWRILDEIKAHTALTASADHRGETILVVEGNGHAANHGRGFGQLGLAIARQVDADLMAQGSEGAGQGADHVGQPAGLRKWNAFGSGEYDVHEGGTSTQSAHVFAAHAIMNESRGTEGPAVRMPGPTSKSTSRGSEGQRAKGSFHAPSANQA